MFLSRVANAISFIFHIKLLTVKTAAQYPTNLVFQIAAAFLIDCAFLVLWLIFFTRFPSLGNWNFNQTALLLAIGWMSYALTAFLGGGIFTLAHTIARGNFDYFLLMPANPLLHQAISKTELTACGNFFASIAMLYVSGYRNILEIILFLIVSSLAAIILFNTLLIVHSLVFWIGYVEIIAQQYLYVLLDTLFYPPIVFKGALKFVIMFFIPAYCIGFLPTYIVQTCSLSALAGLVCIAATSSIFSYSFFHKGMKQYESGTSQLARL